MSLTTLFLLLGAAGLGGAVIGYVFRWLLVLSRKGSIEVKVKQMLLDAREEAKKITEVTQEEAKRASLVGEELLKEKGEKLTRAEERVFKREEQIDKKQGELDSEIEAVKARIEDVKSIRERAEQLLEERAGALAKVAGLTKDEAKERLYAELEREMSDDFMVRLQKLERESGEKLERRAREILTTAIHRMGNSVASDTMATAITIPSDDLKGKIIGKEGRNIKAFERATGVEVIIDDTPGSIVLSSYDPVRRAVARVALENLIIDGRIQPAKIEELVEKAKQEVNKIIKEKGEQAAFEAGVLNLDPKLLQILGRLHFRTSYGQSVLQHSIEMAHLSGMIAEELGANPAVARAGALLHDIGKALDHEVQGTHVEIGRRILQKFGVSEEVIKAMQAHHEEYPYETVESVIVQVADAISGGRPGARRDSVEQYLKRLSDIEQIANSFPGVEKSYAISAGREVRIFVKPEEMSDFAARELARQIALRIENELKYPGEIKVNVIRETRAIEFAR
ncbi:ribonuclease Y [Candidatus Adlerbacteria bacterium RIFCSPHIGHO2_01_FULL_54_23]|uniref:Ribonuclease Y n=3 Tax=Candidatus Adleribacteriota TaxID=1752736 RepID=A0A1F4Y0A0_9BACT|nr:MAG: Ribonuclease Y [Candidatus Adlerbacteria bacterium GW2011_GWA1_54_10]KKW36228.1 MAG: Ribonuclease Y [Candidatus Adlerbacteria bacterium GW2011_GWA2_54_12]KKW37577.1 MAG: Ribonuclease Y [Candidatus Adlerbacteria bacterium GW2011_GWB1_54_7]OGC79419.1 MAG: ribonuclease Y [Candidatus Adlerbacteria bacterium RIFCSPHIGHO2_01_FULL_54_23]OGC87397.1 MAG: ribonuclease Y [Candidatus Adlerbacteria bacterium RIFCSPLOWO2_01_FULL_54_16]